MVESETTAKEVPAQDPEEIDATHQHLREVSP